MTATVAATAEIEVCKQAQRYRFQSLFNFASEYPFESVGHLVLRPLRQTWVPDR
jgi:hypothetical protein